MSEKLSEQENWYVCSLVVQAKPEKLEEVKAEDSEDSSYRNSR